MIKWITENLRSGDADARRAVLMAAMIVVQGLCAAFYMGDAILDLDGSEPLSHLVLESLVATVLCLGVLFFMLELRRLLARMDQAKQGLRAAQGEMSAVIDTFFTRWGLTSAEREVGLLILKGVDNENIARIRGRAVGTVRAQSASIYGKAGVDGRAQLISVFMEELLATDGPA
ncbi:helix-turn-helix transcriptional regulator [Ruegeria arenilitoris]|uniref:helix-turn-helix transcriptional regulator n=1 Tax=Ruegeria arenilitoris TaxID=1173585 RepID=UPI001479906E|nr:helix-turn-helix transcriptional regulator [Ruegeria arenilitoris]